LKKHTRHKTKAHLFCLLPHALPAVDDTLDSMFDVDEEADEEMSKVLDEIGLSSQAQVRRGGCKCCGLSHSVSSALAKPSSLRPR
jgi:hypothetical protein